MVTEYKGKEEQEMRSLMKWLKVAELAGLMLIVGVSPGLGKEPWEGMSETPPIWINLTMTPQIPKLGETVDVVVKVAATSYDLQEAEVYFSGREGVELVSAPGSYVVSLKKGIWKEFKFKVKIIGSPADISVNAKSSHTHRMSNGKIITLPDYGGNGYGLVMDEKSKKFYLPGFLPKRDAVAELQKELIITNYGTAFTLKNDIEKFSEVKKLSREAVIKLLKDKAECVAKKRGVTKDKAYDLIGAERLLWKDAGLPDPFDPKNQRDKSKDQGLLINPSSKGGKVITRVNGYWYYDDHKYDLQSGLKRDTLQDTLTPIRYCRVEVWDLGSPEHRRTEWALDTTVMTGSDGSFNSAFDLPWPAELYDIKIVCKAIGPTKASLRIMVVDSTDNVWKCEVLKQVTSGGVGDYKLHIPRYDPQTNPQPISGAWNIYDMMHRAYQKAYPTALLRVYWDPNKSRVTSFVPPSTLDVNGKSSIWQPPDEWHDDVLLHEYGHFVYFNWTNYIENTDAHAWFNAYPDHPNWSFIEGWAHFFSGVVRDSVSYGQPPSWGVNDSLIVQSNGHIGGGADSLDYVCLENPWHFCWTGLRDSTFFEGGPFCEGAVAGSLNDIMDRYVENPYPPHPKLPEWPDTLPLADTLRIRVTSVQSPFLNIVKNWRSGWFSGNHGVLTIYDFLSGWCYPPDPNNPGYILNSYGHEREIKDILTHHRIAWVKPPAPFNVRAFWDGVKFVIRLYWEMHWPPLGPTPSTPQYFNVYRAIDSPPLTYERLNSVTDTLFVDSTAIGGTAYRYFVTAVDTLGIESDTSQTVAVITGPSSGDPLATAYNNAPKVLRDGFRRLHVMYTDTGGCYYMMSQDSGATWQPRVKLGSKGRYPGLALDARDSLYAVWTKPPGPAPDTEAQILFSRRHGDGTWDAPVPLARYVMPGVDLYGLSPAALAVQNDTARVVYECYNGTRVLLGPMYNWFYSIFHGVFPVSNPPSVRWQFLDSLHAVVPPHILEVTSPGVAVDFNRMSHVVWHRLGKVCYREQVGDTVWKPLLDLSQSADWTSWHPSLSLSGNRLGVAWVLESETLLVDVIPPSAICYRSRLLGDTIWGARETLSVGFQYATRPVLSEGPSVAFSASPTGGGPSEVYLVNRGTSGWTAPENISNTILGSNFPHLFTVQGVSERVSDFLWTEGDAAPYEVVYKEILRPIPPRPWYEADVGQANPSPFTVQRDGYIVYGPLPYQTIDYDHQKLIYRFPGLDTMASYRLLLVAYFEKQVQRDNDTDRIASASPASDLASPVPDGIALESSKPKIEQIVLLNGVEVGRMELVPGVPDTFILELPKTLYQSGTIQLVLDKKKGRFASLSELYLYRWGAWGKKGTPSQGATQGGEGVTLLPRVYDLSQSYPNPARGGLRINYALPKESQVSLKIYNVMGQLVRALREGVEKPGYYTVVWDGKDQLGRRVSSGVYLYRMEAGSFTKTRKLVVVR